jgi:hypothetical protein
MILATILDALDMTARVLWVLRLAAGACGALLGWFVTGPVARIAYRGALRRPVPRWLLPWARLAGAALLGLLLFYFLPLGGGGSLGWGPGAGGPGSGANGSGTTPQDKTATTATAASSGKNLEALEIEVIGGTRYQGDRRFYLIARREPAVTLDQVEEYFKANQDRLAEYVTIVLTPDQSVDVGHPAVLRLNTIIEKYKRRPQVKDVDPGPGK